MKVRAFVAALVLMLAPSAFAYTFMLHGVWYGTVCRNGIYFTAYPRHMAQPVGTACPIRDNFGTIIGYGSVSAE